MSETNEAARLQRILQSLSPEDVAFLARHPLPRWAVQARRRDERDEVIRDARRFLQGTDDGEHARTMSRDLRRYLASAWQGGNGAAPSSDTYRGALHRVCFLNHGVSLGWEQIRNVLRYSRGGAAREK